MTRRKIQSFSLQPEDLERLDLLAKAYDLDKSKVLRMLIFLASTNGHVQNACRNYNAEQTTSHNVHCINKLAETLTKEWITFIDLTTTNLLPNTSARAKNLLMQWNFDKEKIMSQLAETWQWATKCVLEDPLVY